MKRFWSFLVQPVLRDLQPHRIVEIGSQSGESTRALLELCSELGAWLDVVDTMEMANQAEIGSLLEAHGRFHLGTSLEVLPRLPPAGAYLIDGDHNWYTVAHELALIDRASPERPPLVVLHDVAWPYAFRDLYYDPSNLPDDGKHPHRRGGLKPGVAELVPDGEGLNAHLEHAEREGGAKNGVRRAVLDFVEDRPGRYRFFDTPGFNGLGFLVPVAELEQPYALRIAEFCNFSDAHRAFVAALETERLEHAIEVGRQRLLHRQDVQAAKRELERRAQRMKSLEARIAELESLLPVKVTRRAQGLMRRLRRRRASS